MKKCNSCGFDNADDSRFCATCGASLTDEPFIPEKRQYVPPVTESADNSAVEDNNSSVGENKPVGFKAKAAAKKDKAVAFERKHGIIVNAIVAVCAIVIAFVALFAPIQTVEYIAVFSDGSNIEIDEAEGGTLSYSHVEIDQSIWQMLGAIKYIKTDQNDLNELKAEYDKISSAIAVDVLAWQMKHHDASREEAVNAQSEIIADHLSDFNYLGFVLATSQSVTSGNGEYATNAKNEGDYYAALISLVFGLCITTIAVVIAVVSLVFLILAIVAAVGKKQQKGLYKYLGAILGLSGSGLSLMFAAPMFKAGGGMFAVAMFAAIVYFVCGIVGALVTGRDGTAVIVKRAAVALFAMVAFFILCTDLFCFNAVADEDKISIDGPTGYGIFRALSVVNLMSGGEDVGAGGYYEIGSALTGAVFYILVVGFCVGYVFTAMTRSLKRLACGEVKKSSCTPFMIVSVVFMLIAVVSGLAFSNTITEAFIKLLDGEPSGDETVKWLMNAPMWASMIMLLIAAVFNLAYNPKPKAPPSAPENTSVSVDII